MQCNAMQCNAMMQCIAAVQCSNAMLQWSATVQYWNRMLQCNAAMWCWSAKLKCSAATQMCIAMLYSNVAMQCCNQYTYVDESMHMYIYIYSPKRACSMGFSGTKELVEVHHFPGPCSPSKVCFPLGTYRQLWKELAVAAKGRSVVFRTCTNLLKMKLTFCQCWLVQWHINDLLIYWIHMWLKC